MFDSRNGSFYAGNPLPVGVSLAEVAHFVGTYFGIADELGALEAVELAFAGNFDVDAVILAGFVRTPQQFEYTVLFLVTIVYFGLGTIVTKQVRV